MALLTAAPSTAQMVEGAADALPLPSPTFRAVPSPAVALPLRTKSSGTWYKRPKGAYFIGFGLDDRGYYPTVLYVRPWQAVVFEDADASKRGAWHTWTFNHATNTGDYFNNPAVVVNASGDYQYSYTPVEQYYTPTLTLGEDSFSIGEENYFHVLKTNNSAYPGRLMAGGKVVLKSTDDHQRFYHMGRNYSNLQRWGIVGDNVFGTGIVYEQYLSYGAAQVFDRPMGPLSVYETFIQGSSYSMQPIPEGDTLFCYVSKCHLRSMSNGTTLRVPTHEYTDTLYAFSGDTLNFVKTTVRNGQTIHEGYVRFHKYGDDGSILPVTIDPSDFDENGFALVVKGFDRPGMDVGVYGYYFNSDVDDVVEGQMLFINPATGATGFDVYHSGLAMNIGMVAIYDNIIISNLNGANQLYVSDDGKTCRAKNGSAGVVVVTSQPWQDYDGRANYRLSGLPEWVEAVQADGSAWAKYNHRGENTITLTCQPLPEGLDRRTANIVVEGSGVASHIPIRIIQDRVTLGIHGNSTTDNASNTPTRYNTAGQRIGTHSRGIVIQGGSKKAIP